MLTDAQRQADQKAAHAVRHDLDRLPGQMGPDELQGRLDIPLTPVDPAGLETAQAGRA
jgi:hypothetical protein